MSGRAPLRVEGVDYSPEGIMDLYAEVARFRDEALRQNEFGTAVSLSHVLALLFYLAELERQAA